MNHIDNTYKEFTEGDGYYLKKEFIKIKEIHRFSLI